MREIIFRGKRKDNGEWVYGSYIRLRADEPSVFDTYHIYSYVDDEFYDVAPKTVSEYTGLMDNNGKRIFEGDIIQYKTKYDVAPIYSYVVYCADTDNYPAFDLEQHAYEINGLQGACRECLCEVIGNKWDNPELLEEQE